MKFKKCCRCGCFYITKDAVCPNCMQKEENDISTLKNFYNENGIPSSMESLSTQTGISLRNVNRLISSDKELSNIFNKKTNL